MTTTLAKDQEELVAIGAAIAANCQPCVTFHIRQGRESGLTDTQLRAAVAVAQKVKETPARLVLETADRLLARDERTPAEPAPSACCG
jgi:AhpD family alkylhydroperoxidase